MSGAHQARDVRLPGTHSAVAAHGRADRQDPAAHAQRHACRGQRPRLQRQQQLHLCLPAVRGQLPRALPQIRSAFGNEEPQQLQVPAAPASWDCSNVAPITPTTPTGAGSWQPSPRAESWDAHRPVGKMRRFSMSSNDAIKNKKKFSLRFWSRGPTASASGPRPRHQQRAFSQDRNTPLFNPPGRGHLTTSTHVFHALHCIASIFPKIRGSAGATNAKRRHRASMIHGIQINMRRTFQSLHNLIHVSPLFA